LGFLLSLLALGFQTFLSSISFLGFYRMTRI
jgi:hypothetical protein